MQQWQAVTQNERYHLDSYISFLKPLLEVLKIIDVLKIIQHMKVQIHIYGFSTGIPLYILIIYGKDLNYN